jgi:hypothetical protein
MPPSDHPPKNTLARFAKAVYLSELRSYPEWVDAAAKDLDGKTIVYVHDDYTVNTSIVRGMGVVFRDVTPAWRAFLETVIVFKVPEHVVRTKSD